MTRRSRSRVSVGATAIVASLMIAGASFVGATAPVAAAARHHDSVQVIASNLNNPRSLAFGKKGRILVSEAGVGGPNCFGPSGNQVCVGLTGSVAAIDTDGKVHTVAHGLFSVSAGQEGVTGPDGLARANGHLYTVMTDSSAVVPPGLPGGVAVAAYNQLGRELVLKSGNRHPIVSDPGDLDYAWSNRHKNKAPGNFPDANPYAILVRKHVAYVVDAGANTLDKVRPDGSVRILAFIPNPPVSDAVPTCVAQGPDRALYIGELTGAGNGPTDANVYRWTQQTGLKVWKTGFSAISGCGFDKNGNFYVTEFDTTGFPPSGAPAGAVIQIAPNGTRTALGQGQLFAPNGFLAGSDGSIYVTNWSVMPGESTNNSPTGQVVKITP